MSDAKMVDMSRDPEQLDIMASDYDPKYPLGFFLDPRMVEELGIRDMKAGDELKVQGVLRIKSRDETDNGDDENKVEMYVNVKSLGVMGKDKESATEKMSETYSDGNG